MSWEQGLPRIRPEGITACGFPHSESQTRTCLSSTHFVPGVSLPPDSSGLRWLWELVWLDCPLPSPSFLCIQKWSLPSPTFPFVLGRKVVGSKSEECVLVSNSCSEVCWCAQAPETADNWLGEHCRLSFPH